jgi:flagellar biosynthetic protein FlhB
VVAYSINALGPFWFKTLYSFYVETFENIPSYVVLDFGTGSRLAGKALLITFLCVAPIAALAFFATWLMNLLQVGVLITFKPLSIEEGIKKLNPIQGIKRIFSMKQVFELVKSFIKILIIAWVIYGVVKEKMGPLLRSMDMHPAGALGFAGSLVLEIAQKLALTLLAIAGADYFFQRWQYEKSLRMSHKEIKDEYKKLEGDPLVKSRQRQKQMEMAMSAMRGKVPEADIVVTNPTHFAVALAYKPRQGMKSPKVVAKGKDRAAREIRRIAEENFILVVEDPPTAQALYAACKVDQDIPPELFHAVAKIIALLYKGRRKPRAQVPAEMLMPVAAPPIMEEAADEMSVKPAPSELTPPIQDLRDEGGESR